ncbi:MAG: hypothetical protein JWP42_931 [Pseudomonas sp.]|nr:hypothetical protein [Pseudomonas sp.]
MAVAALRGGTGDDAPMKRRTALGPNVTECYGCGVKASERVTGNLPDWVVLHARNLVQWHVRWLINRRNFKTTHHQWQALTHFDRLSGQCFCHFRVVRCDFAES